MTKRVVILDTEYNQLQSWKADKCWCLVAKDIQTGEVFKFHPKLEGDYYHNEFREEVQKFLASYNLFVGHNFMGAEDQILKQLFGIDLEPSKIVDTLVWSRTLRPSAPRADTWATLRKQGLDNRSGGHGLEAWGERLGYPKDTFDDFSRFSFALLDRCVQDVEINHKVYIELLKEQKTFGIPQEVLDLEQDVHRILQLQTINGFTLDKTVAEKLLKDTDNLIEDYTKELFKVFPPKKKLIKVLTLRTTKGGKLNATDVKTLHKNLHEEVSPGVYNLYELETFNPDSPKQVAERLLDLGWIPRKFTPTSGLPSTSKEVIGEAVDQLASKYPEVEVLRKFSVVLDRNQTARKWLELSKEDGKLHGRVNHIGPWTMRSSHYDPNMGNIAKVQTDPKGKPMKGLEGNFGYECRSCFTSREGWTLVGCDASAIQLRALSHYMGDLTYIKAVCEGDVHTLNQEAAGITAQGVMSARDVAKRFIYAWLLGGGDERIGQVIGVDLKEHTALFKEAEKISKYNRFIDHEVNQKGTAIWGPKDNLLWFTCDKLRDEGRKADPNVVATIIKGHITKKKFLESLPALRHFKERTVKDAADKGYMIGLDGRKIWCDSAHFMVGAFLQGFEAVVMKKAMVLTFNKLTNLKVPFVQVAFVHDELEIECPEEYADLVGQTLKESIVEAGVILGSKCPLDGAWRKGKSWADVH